MQVSVPWKILGIKPSSGTEFRFDVGIDNSDDGLMRRQQLMWNGNAQNSSARGAWGRAKLIDN
jgi:hypothetical protein